jgi:RNA polymerase sigma-70 factor (sigma-E family)
MATDPLVTPSVCPAVMMRVGNLSGGPGTVSNVALSLETEGLALTPSFDVYVRDRSAALLRLAFLLTGDRYLAEDLVQTSLVKVMRHWQDVADKGDPHAYVRKVLLHTALGWRRRRWRGEEPSERLPDAGTPDRTAVVDSRERLRRALVSLPPRQRAAVVLRHYEDMSEAQVALELGCSVGTVKSQTARGLERLRALLSTGGIDDQQ